MTSDERDITGAADTRELRTMRDSLADMAASMAHLAGRFEEHAETEEHWQDRVTDWMQHEPERITSGAQAVVKSCRDAAEPDVQAALTFYREQAGERLDQRAVKHWLTGKAFFVVLVLIVLAFAVATYMLVVDDLDHAATVTAMIGVFVPFALAVFRRKN